LEGIRQFAILAAVNAPGSVAGSLPQCGRPDVILEGRLVNKKFIPAFFVGLMLGTGSVAAHDLRVRFAAVLRTPNTLFDRSSCRPFCSASGLALAM